MKAMEAGNKRRLPGDTSFPWEEARYQSKTNCIRKAIAELEDNVATWEVMRYLESKGIEVRSNQISIYYARSYGKSGSKGQAMSLVQKLNERVKEKNNDIELVEEWLNWMNSIQTHPKDAIETLQFLKIPKAD